MSDDYRGIEALRPRRVPASGTVGSKPAPRRKTRLLGVSSVLLAIVTMFVVGAGTSMAYAGNWAGGTALGWIAVVISVVGGLCGAVAALTGRGVGWGCAGLILCVVADPLVLTRLLGIVGGAG